ncbi:hypothetical protein KEM52_004914, partial [Ascosphaera acerosa]
MVRNDSGTVIRLSKGTPIGHCFLIDEQNCYAAEVEDARLALHHPQHDGSALRIPQAAESSVCPNGVTIAAAEDRAPALRGLVEEYAKLWEDDGTPARIP